eukprot:CAMPEP_0117751272 /NCGR_PEP_ID=MMETSP0947-20121206/10873_1 /TAXON_ID=44440 /ORGANISM="Chattonella subsalsa, Strain CCMP2191" /LENGTH=291 /DNA_ID=CAMNT_0005569615 /DNA_START=269 /DNA_END=1144 /DNA_ORIENTATION=+
MKKDMQVGDIIVPIIGQNKEWFKIRRNIFSKGVYPGVEYKVLQMESNGKLVNAMNDVDSEEQLDVRITVKPIYPLVSELEREWPVSIQVSEVPIFITRGMYNYGTAVGAAATSASFFATAFVLSQLFSFYYIPSHSMEPTLEVGDLLLVEKVSRGTFVHKGDIVLFNPPEELRQVVQNSGGKIGIRDLFVKRVAGLPGDRIHLTEQGGAMVNGAIEQRIPIEEDKELPGALLTLINPKKNDIDVGSKSFYVLGDNPFQSVDSRVWGTLPSSNIVGHPLIRIFPLSRFGFVN